MTKGCYYCGTTETYDTEQEFWDKGWSERDSGESAGPFTLCPTCTLNPHPVPVGAPICCH